MKTQSQYIAIYKDNVKAPNKYYGPFMSVTQVEQFVSILPEPQLGGLKTWKHISPYTHDEASLAREVILRQRTHGSYLSH